MDFRRISCVHSVLSERVHRGARGTKRRRGTRGAPDSSTRGWKAGNPERSGPGLGAFEEAGDSCQPPSKTPLPRSRLQATPKYHSPLRPSGVSKLAYSGAHSSVEAAVENEGGIWDVSGSDYLRKELAGPKGTDDPGCRDFRRHHLCCRPPFTLAFAFEEGHCQSSLTAEV